MPKRMLNANVLSRNVSLLLIVAVGGLLLFLSLKIFLILFASCLIAVFLFSIASFLQRYLPIGYKWSLALGISLLSIFFALFMAYLFPKVSTQLNDFVARLPGLIDEVRAFLERYMGPDVTVREWLDQNAQMLRNISTRTLQSVTTLFSALSTFMAIIVLGTFLAFEPKLYKSGFVKLIAPETRAATAELLTKIFHDLRWWLVGRLSSMFFVGILTTIGLFYLNVPMALGIGFLSGLLDFIPFIGPVLAAIPAILMASTQDGQTVTYVILLYGAVQLIEGYVLTPLIQKQAVSLPPALALFAILLMGKFGGLLGTALAAPLTVVLLLIVKEVYIKAILEKKIALDSPSTLGKKSYEANNVGDYY